MKLFHISIDGQIITSEPLTMTYILGVYGSVQQLEKEGFRLVEYKRDVKHAKSN